MKTQPKPKVPKNFVCDYGTRHAFDGPHSFDNCQCASKYGNAPVTFFRFLHEKYKIRNTADVTPEMQKDFLVEYGLWRA